MQDTYVVDYEHNMSFVLVHGAGHIMVPENRPQSALHLLRVVAEGRQFSPFLPSDDRIEDRSDDEFEALVGNWTMDTMDACSQQV
jgi:hypothetical protein